MADFSIPLAGMSNAASRLNTAATRIARAPFANAPNPSTTPPEGQDSVSLSDDMVAMLESRNDFEANTKVVKTFDEMTKSLLNILG